MAALARRTALILALLCAVGLSSPTEAASVKLFAFDESGAPLGLSELRARLLRADERAQGSDALPFWAVPLDEKSPPARVKLAAEGKLVVASWPGGPARLQLVWPVKEDGVNAVAADNNDDGFADGAAVFLDEEIALTQYRAFQESWKRRTTDWDPLYAPGKKAQRLASNAKQSIAAAASEKEAPKRAAAFKKALQATALAWEKELYEHGQQIALDPRRGPDKRFGLTLDDSLLKRLDDADRIVDAVRRSGSGWVRLVFRPNPGDFLYGAQRSFNEYDDIVAKLGARKIKIMACLLDTAQWPNQMTPAVYAERVKNIVLHYKGRVSAWEVGSEINGNWLGGASAPLTPDQVFKIYSAGAAKAKELDPKTETVATLYWWEETAPDREHSLSGWLKRYEPQGFGKNIDVVGLELYPEDNPLGMSFERAFDSLYDALPRAKLMLSSFGYVEKDALKGYWWLAPDDVEGARKDLLVLYTAASCAMRSSVCGGFWWQTLDQMLPPGRRRVADLYKAHVRAMSQLGQKAY